MKVKCYYKYKVEVRLRKVVRRRKTIPMNPDKRQCRRGTESGELSSGCRLNRSAAVIMIMMERYRHNLPTMPILLL